MHLPVGSSLLPHQISMKRPPWCGFHPRTVPPCVVGSGEQGLLPLGHRGEGGEQHWQQKLSAQSDCKTTAENSFAVNVQVQEQKLCVLKSAV